MLTIKSKSFVSEKGKREINEDCIEFQSGKFYIVCDGLGGNGNGQIASKLVAETVKESLLNLKSISEAVKDAEIVLSSYKKKNLSTDYMATTIAVAEILDTKILVSWAGDSRFYRFRDGKVVFKTTDHSWVADAFKKGVLSSVEALFHPRANELTKSIKDASNPVKLEQVLIQDIRLNDYFLICSDGVTESWIDTDLQELFTDNKTTDEIVEELEKNCNVFSDDNYSAIVFNLKKKHFCINFLVFLVIKIYFCLKTYNTQYRTKDYLNMKKIFLFLTTLILLYSCSSDNNPNNTIINNSFTNSMDYEFTININGQVHKVKGNTTNGIPKGQVQSAPLNYVNNQCEVIDNPLNKIIDLKINDVTAPNYISGQNVWCSIAISNLILGTTQGQVLFRGSYFDSLSTSLGGYANAGLLDFQSISGPYNPNLFMKLPITITDLGTTSLNHNNFSTMYNFGQTLKGQYSGTVYLRPSSISNFSIPVQISIDFKALRNY